MQGINTLQQSINRIDNAIEKLGDKFDKLDNRLRSVEKTIYICIGVLITIAILWGVIKWGSGYHTITPKL